MKKIVLLAAALLLAAYSCAYADNIVLVGPDKSGGPSVLEAISNRASAPQQNFTDEELTSKELSTILWAATGKNREPRGWTIPLAKGLDPYVSVYVLLKSGGYLYDWDKNTLKQITTEAKVLNRSVGQDFAKTAPCILVFVSNGTMMIENFNYIAAGSMSQNVYLAAQAMNLKARFIASFNKTNIESSLMLSPAKTILGVMVVGRQ